MRKKLVDILICGVLLLGITGCGNSSKLVGDEPLENHTELMFTIETGNKSCIPVKLAVYEDGQYELFTAYKSCRVSENCNTMLKYTKSKKGTYSYNVVKILEDEENEVDKSHSMDNLPEYEMYVGNTYVEYGYGYYYTVEKSKTNKYLDEFLKEIDVDLKVCAEPEYID